VMADDDDDDPSSSFTPSMMTTRFDRMFLRDDAFLGKLFSYMCSHNTAPEDPITNTAVTFLHGKIQPTLSAFGLSVFEDPIIFPFFRLSSEQRLFLFEVASRVASPGGVQGFRFKISNKCLTLVEFSSRQLDQRQVWNMILRRVYSSKKHTGCLRLLSNVVIQRVCCRVQHGRDVLDYIHRRADELQAEKINCHPPQPAEGQ
jgi:hypothetical protein